MSDEMTTPEMNVEASAAATSVQSTMETFFETAHVDHVYGEPMQHGDTLIIPAAEVLVGMGFGSAMGYGSGSSPEGEGEGEGGGGGGGGGGRTLSRPVAVVIATPQGVRVEPVIDPTKIVMAAITAGGFMLAMLTRMKNPRRALRRMNLE